MMLVETYPVTIKLWLAAEPPHSGEEPEDQAPHPDLDGQSLRVLIVEDEFFISLDTKALVTALGHTVVGVAVSADQAVRIAERERPDLVLMDIRLSGERDGIEAAAEILTRFGIRSIFVTANTDARMRQKAAVVRPMNFLEKPLTKERLRIVLSGFGQKH
jgi:two-component system, response regulator PdtaR